ncbi:MAG: FmdB family transcriptional regulator [Rickettsiales bacterium]|nr:FmdB family transcriptional regulator [Verrucomicrobiaceae bacterium]MBV63262.1 FmdB family transcriptional regulator [Rickettsiales bacterium]|tara:strand:- start:1160 stop:1453 length:294 start_codon:yes stop_codon:yes gene_type:complete
MPTYEYYCEKCEQTFEVFQSMKDRKLKKCQDKNCGGVVERLLGTGAGVIFKGSGFYETDYRSDSYKAGAKADADKKKSSSDSENKKPKAKKNKKKDT